MQYNLKVCLLVGLFIALSQAESCFVSKGQVTTDGKYYIEFVSAGISGYGETNLHYQGMTMNDCMRQCIARDDCVAIEWNPEESQCKPKSAGFLSTPWKNCNGKWELLQLCEDLIDGCSVCNHQDTCITCRDPNAKGGQTNCKTCNDGYNWSGSSCVRNFCYDYGCTLCTAGNSSSEQDCLQCSESVTRNGPESDCDCKTGFYETGNDTCPQCPVRCATCVNNDKCTSCKNQNTYEGSCAPIHGYVEVNGEVLKCAGKCDSCDGSTTNCLTCSENRFLPNCDPLPGFVENDQGVVVPCNDSCEECSGIPSNCTVCPQDNCDLPSCNPSEGYFKDSEGDVRMCDLQCKHCANDSDHCTACYGENRDLPTCAPSAGFYDNGDGFVQKCADECETCVGHANVCLTCKDRTLEAPYCGGSDELEVSSLENCVKLYSHCDYTGDVRHICRNESDSEDFRYLSVKVPEGLEVKIYEETDWEGEWLQFDEDVPCLTDLEWEDTASLLKQHGIRVTKVEKLQTDEKKFQLLKAHKPTDHLAKNKKFLK